MKKFPSKLVLATLLSFLTLQILVIQVGYAFTSGPDSTTRRQKITITENSGSALTNYPVKMTITYDADMQADFDDIRFTTSDGATEIDYWLETKTNSSSATVWVEVPSISASSTATIYLYYGNASSSSESNGDNVFTFFDDFTTQDNAWNDTGTTTGSSKSWTTTDSQNVLKLDGTSSGGNAYKSVYNQAIALGNGLVAEMNVYASTDVGGGFATGTSLAGAYKTGWHGGNLYGTGNTLVNVITNTTSTNVNKILTTNRWYKVISSITGSTTYVKVIDTTNGTTEVTSSGSSTISGSFYPIVETYDVGSFDFFHVRSYISSEPSTSFGSEQSYGTAYRDSLNNLLENLFSITPNAPGTPGDNAPVVESVEPNFSGLVTGGGPQNSGVEITSDGALVVRSDNSSLAFGVQSNNSVGFGIISKSTATSGIGLYSVGKHVGIYASGSDVALQAEGVTGISVKGDSEIGIKAQSANIGSMFEGDIGLQAQGQEFGVLGIGKQAGVIGYFSDSDWGSLGYVNGGKMYGLYTDSLTKINGNLDSFGTLDVADITTVSGSIGVSEDASFDVLQTNIWENTISSNPITWYADDVSVTQDLEGPANLSVNTSRSSWNDFVIKDGGLIIGGSTIDSGGRSFKVTSDLEVKNGDLSSTGKITAGSEIGSFYYRQSAESSSPSVYCDSNDWLVGCSGQVFSGEGYIETSTPSDRTCSVKTTSSSTNARAYAYCFDPTTVSNTSSGLSSLPDTDSGGGDGFPDFQDNCQDVRNSTQTDTDSDGVGDACDNCVNDSNPTQTNSDGDAYGYACDCDDSRRDVYPGASEACDGVDNDCDGYTDEYLKDTYYRDADGDDYGNPSFSSSECSEPDGYVSNNDDCDDNDASVHPGATEICGNGKDDDCSGGDATCPDTTPPTDGQLDGIQYLEPSFAAIAWSGFSDDVGIVNYILADSFTDYPSTCSGTSVGNVRGYNYPLNASENTYYFRLCAVDSAGHKSAGIVFSLGVTRDDSGAPMGAPDIGEPR